MPAVVMGGAPETFGELNRRHGLRSLFETVDASCAILSAQYDGLDCEDQLTCGAWIFHDSLMNSTGEPLTTAGANAVKCSPAQPSIPRKVS